MSDIIKEEEERTGHGPLPEDSPGDTAAAITEEEDDFSVPVVQTPVEPENKDTAESAEVSNTTASAEPPEEEFLEEEELPGRKRSFNFFSEENNGVLKKVLKYAGITLGVLAILFCATITAVILSLPTDTVAEGISIGPADLSGKTYEETLAAIQQTVSLDSQEITVTAGGKTFAITSGDIDLKVLPEKTAKKAFEYGKSGNKIADAIAVLRLKFHEQTLKPVPELSLEKLDAKLNEFGEQVCGTLKGHSVEFKDGNIAVIVPGKTGYDGNPAIAREQILGSMADDKFLNIPVTFSTETPHNLTLDELDATVYQDPADAYYAMENNEVTIVPEKVGRYLNREEAAPLVATVAEGGPNVEIPYYVSAPAVTQAILKEKLFNAKLASFTTRFSAGGNRGANVALAASKMNQKIIMPGETFSFNQTVGRRTVANGFKTAPEYQNGQTVEGVGGGTCQVSTTLYSAVLYSDLKVIKRSNHSMSVSYVPLGQDATVTDGGIDFQFQNDTGYPVKIQAGTSGGNITVTIVGTQPEPAKTVKLTHKPVAAQTGSAVKTTRTTYDAAGNVIKTENMGISRYKPHTPAA